MRARVLSVSVFLLMALAAVPFAQRIELDDDYAAFFPPHDRAARDYERYLANFPSDTGAVVLAEGEDLCTESGFALLKDYVDDVADVPGVQRVTALVNSKYVESTPDLVDVQYFPQVRPPAGKSLCDLALAYPPYQNKLITRADGEFLQAIFIIIDPAAKRIPLSHTLEELTRLHSEKLQRNGCNGGCDARLLFGGELALTTEISRVTQEGTMLLAFSLVLMLVVSVVATRSLAVGLLASGTGMFALLAVFAAMGVLRIPLSPVNMLVANFLVPLGSAYAIHAYGYLQREAGGRVTLVPIASIKPFVFATLTTAIGFSATAISASPTVQQFGLFGTFGVVVCLFTTFFFTMPLLGSTKDPVAQSEAHAPFILGRRTTLAVLLLSAVVTAVGVGRLRVGYEPIAFLRAGNPVRAIVEKQLDTFGGYLVPMTIFQDEPGAALEPAVLRAAREFVEKDVRLQSINVQDQLSVLKRALLEEDSSEPLLPDSAEEGAQLLLSFNGRDIAPFLNGGRSDLTMLLQARFRRRAGFQEIERRVNEFAKRTGYDAVLTGRIARFFRTTYQVAWGNVTSLFVGILFVSLCFFTMLRSIRLTVISMLPNVLPVVGSLAYLGLTGTELDIGNSIFATCALGLVVDDTGHIVTRFKELLGTGVTAAAAAKRSIAELRRPVITTTLAIVIGLSVLNFSQLVPFHSFSQILILSLLLALFGDAILLPALLTHFGETEKDRDELTGGGLDRIVSAPDGPSSSGVDALGGSSIRGRRARGNGMKSVHFRH